MREMTVWTRFAAKLEAKPLRLVLLGALALAAVSAACSAPGEDAAGIAREAASTFPNDKTAYDYFRAKGLTNFQAAAVVGNLDQESGVNPTISQEGGGVGRGIAQWSTGDRWDTAKGDNVMAFAAMEGQSATSLGLQLDFMWFELTMFPDYGLAKLKASTTLNDATQVFEDNYEGCVYANFPECDLPQRQKYAATVFAAYMNDPVMGSGGAGSGGASGSSTGGSSGASQGGSPAGGSSAGGSSGASSAGSSSAGAPGAAGAPNSGGDLNAGAGAANVAGAPSGASTAGATSAAGGASGAASFPQANAKNDSSCAVSRPGTARPRDGSIGFWSALVALGLSVRVSRRRRRKR